MLNIINLKKLTIVAMTLMSLAAAPLMGLGVYASYRCNQDQTINQNRNLAFNIEDINVGQGISKSSAPVAGDQFEILVSGDYLINYGAQSALLLTQAAGNYNLGYSLILIRNNVTSTLDNIIANYNSSGIVVSLLAGDVIRVVSQTSQPVAHTLSHQTVSAGGQITEATTSFITFVKLDAAAPCPGSLR